MADILVLSPESWEPQAGAEPQKIAVALAAAGHRVVFVHVPSAREAATPLRQQAAILRLLQSCLQPPRRLSERLWLWRLPAAATASGAARHWPSSLALAWLRRRLGFQSCLLWTFTPLTVRLCRPDREVACIYQPITGGDGGPDIAGQDARLAAAERELSRQAAWQFSADPKRYRALAAWNPRATPLPAPVAVELFGQAIRRDGPCPEALTAIAGPRLLHAGPLDPQILDLDLLLTLVRRMPGWSFLFMGCTCPRGELAALDSLLACPNVHLLKADSPAAWAGLLAHCDAAWLPWRRQPDPPECLPAALLEPLAAGLPVVAPHGPAFQALSHALLLSPPTAAGFERAVAAALAARGPSAEQRIGAAHAYRHDRRTRRMLSVLWEQNLLPLGAPIFLRPSLLRGKAPQARAGLAEQLAGKFAWLVVLGLGSVVQPRQAARIVALASERWPRNPTILQSLNVCHLQAGDYAAACTAMEDLWEFHGDVHQIHRLLFRRSARPHQIDHQIALFETLGASRRLPFSYRCYCQIVQAYRCIDASRTLQMRRLTTSLAAIADELEQDPGTWTCQRENRVNRAKLLISTYTTLARLDMALADFQALAAIGERAAGFVDRLDLTAIDADTAYRLTRNLMRCLAIEVLEAWRTDDRGRFALARARLARFQAHCHLGCYDDSLAQEDHRGFANDFMAEIDALADCIGSAAKQSSQIHGVLQLMIKDKRKPVEQIAALFVPYLDVPFAENQW